MPRTIPTSGFVLGVGATGWTSVLSMRRLLPGLSDGDLGTCLMDGLVVPSPCFARPGAAQLGGAVSGGASALWYYRLPPGDYIVGQGGLTAWPYDASLAHALRITVR